MMARNKMAHTTRVPDDDAKVKKLIKLCWAYRTLFNRVILKLLGYQGTYIDYYTDGFPERNIDEPIPKV